MLNVRNVFYYPNMKKISSSVKKLIRYKVKFPVQKNTKFSNIDKIGINLVRSLRNFTLFKF